MYSTNSECRCLGALSLLCLIAALFVLSGPIFKIKSDMLVVLFLLLVAGGLEFYRGKIWE
jgi:hypothetical protein